MKDLSHMDKHGRPAMVDVGGKPAQHRTARAEGHITLSPETIALITQNALRKGNALLVAELAGVQAAKRTGELIPLCHPLSLTHVKVEARLEDTGVRIEAETACIGPTGVEMEALMAVSTALLTIYDMCKAVDRQMQIGDIRLVEKTKRNL